LDQQGKDKAIPGCLPSPLQRSTSLLDLTSALFMLCSVSGVRQQHSS